MDRQRLIVATNHGQRTTVLPEMPPKKPERQTEVLCVLCVMPAEQLAQTNIVCAGNHALIAISFQQMEVGSAILALVA